MPIPPLTIIPAGAGSGKTYTIQKTLARWVIDGAVRADRIVAVTFTEAAAAEMRERIKQELSQQNRIEDALLLEQSYITTIHSFGLRILKEFAFDCGISPNPRLLNKDEEVSLMRRALASSDKGDAVLDNLVGFGYTYDFGSGKGAEELFRAAILQLIATMRSIGRITPDVTLLPHAEALVKQLYGPTGDSARLEEQLHRAVNNLLNTFPADMSEQYGNNATALKAFRKDYRNLKRAQDKTLLSHDWKLWQQLRNLRTIDVPPAYQAAATEVMAAANELPNHPGPLNDALIHLRALLQSSQDALAIHSEKKRQAGLLDYTDMLAMSHQLFSSNSDVKSMLQERMDCLIIDEFQDTNPLQFSLLWQFFTLGVPVLIVGDIKQAIMGFQNADARLLEALQNQYPHTCKPLTGNWRSTPTLMKWINAMGEALFGSGYTPLAAQADYPSTIAPLEVLRFNKRARQTHTQVRATARHIRDLLAAGTTQIYDRHSGRQRQLRGGDLAVLCPTNSRLELFASELRHLGLTSRIAQGGWFESRVVQLMYHALDYVANPADRHAALYMSVTELGNLPLETALQQMITEQLPDAAVITTLQSIAQEQEDLAVPVILERIIDKLSLYEHIATWPDAEQARANLMRLQHEATTFHTTDPAALASVGFFGSGIKTFLSWLGALVEQEENNRQPEARTSDDEAIELVTWHSSKGREWPVVVVAGLEQKVSAWLPSFDVTYKDFDDLAAILDQARIEISPDFAAPETCHAFQHRLLPEIYTSAQRLQYVAFTRAREQLIIEWPQYLAKSTAKDKTHWALLREQGQMDVGADTFTIGAQSFPCLVSDIAFSKDDNDAGQHGDNVAPQTTNYSIKAAMVKHTTTLTADSTSPSQLHGTEKSSPLQLHTQQYAPALNLELDLSPAQRGTLLHQCYELALDASISFVRANELIEYPVSAHQWEIISHNIDAFRHHLNATLAPVAITCELPLLFLDQHNRVVSGIIDLLVECEDGFWIIDHKSDIGNNDVDKFATYLPQLRCYAAAVGQTHSSKPVLGVAINWIDSGQLMSCDMTTIQATGG